MLQRSVLGSLLFVNYINDLDNNIVNLVGKFTDDTRIGGIVVSEKGYLSLKQDIDH